MVALTPPPVSAPLVTVTTTKKKTKDGSSDIDVRAVLNPIWSTWFTNVFARTGSFDETPYAPNDSTYIVRTAESSLTGSQTLASLSSGFLKVTTTTGTLTSSGSNTIDSADIGALQVTTAKLAADAVTNAKIGDGEVSLEHLDSGIAPSHVVKFAGSFTTAGGDANETITVSGAAATDIAFVTVSNRGGTPRVVESALAGTNKIDVVMSGDPSTDHTLKYMILRAAS